LVLDVLILNFKFLEIPSNVRKYSFKL